MTTTNFELKEYQCFVFRLHQNPMEYYCLDYDQYEYYVKWTRLFYRDMEKCPETYTVQAKRMKLVYHENFTHYYKPSDEPMITVPIKDIYFVWLNVKEKPSEF